MTDGFVSINYDEISSDSYTGVNLRLPNGQKLEYNTGDPITDWNTMMDYWEEEYSEHYNLNFSSSVDHFQMCDRKYTINDEYRMELTNDVRTSSQ